jgi:hypothetical protein
MRRIITFSIFGLAVTMFGFAYSQSPKPVAPKAGKVLVKSLPKGIEGVQLVGGEVTLKSGYKWVKHPNGTVTVAQMRGGAGGLGATGSFYCDCYKGGGGMSSGSCAVDSTGTTLHCITGTCNGSCALKVRRNGRTTDLIMY